MSDARHDPEVIACPACGHVLPQTITVCATCNEAFVLSREERAWFESRNMSAPRRCFSCRKRRAAERASGRLGPREADPVKEVK